MQRDGNLFDDDAPPATGERFEILCRAAGVRIERIVSSAVPVPGTYVQDWDEWVVLLRGEATLVIAGEETALVAGDHLFLPARVPHRVERTTAGALWLAVHLEGE
ncbi:MAG: cupin domain-containing protein [Myxococcales bacterium]|nr:cupin domain-containing protein [Myxococcales bacterium]